MAKCINKILANIEVFNQNVAKVNSFQNKKYFFKKPLTFNYCTY